MEKETRPAFLFYASDFASGTKGMDAATIGMYVLLLCYQWENGSIPSDEKQLWRIACADSIEHFRDAWAMLKHKFSSAVASGKKGHLQNDKLEIVRLTSKEKDKQRSIKASNAAKRRWELQRERERLEKEGCLHDAQALHENMLNECSSNAIIEDGDGDGDSVVKKDSLQPLQGNTRGVQGGFYFAHDYEAQRLLFNDFMQAYGQFGRAPKRASIEQALIDAVRHLQSLKPDATIQQCCDFLVAQASLTNQSDQKNGQTKRLNPETWLQERAYETDISKIKMPAKQSSIEAMDEAIRSVLTKHIQEQEANK